MKTLVSKNEEKIRTNLVVLQRKIDLPTKFIHTIELLKTKNNWLLRHQNPNRRSKHVVMELQKKKKPIFKDNAKH